MSDVAPTLASCDAQLGGGFIPRVKTAFVSQEVHRPLTIHLFLHPLNKYLPSPCPE